MTQPPPVGDIKKPSIAAMFVRIELAKKDCINALSSWFREWLVNFYGNTRFSTSVS